MAKNRSYANRGMDLEREIDKVNERYSSLNVAAVIKIPTPIRIISKVGGMVKGFTESGYCVDYIGAIEGGHTIAFDAKETKGKSLPLKNIHEHQYYMMMEWENVGATTFILVHFKDLGEYYRLPFGVLDDAWVVMENGGKKSIPIKTFIEHGMLIEKNNGLLDYLGVLR